MDIRVTGLTKNFGSTTALSDVSLDVPEGSLTCFLGPSGCGKTTLLRVIAGLEEADAGQILLGDADLSRTPARDRNFGVVFQSYSLFPNLTAAQNVAYGLECRRWSKPDTRRRVAEMLDLVHLDDQRDKLPAQMSGGQQQRIAIARALAPHPSLLLLDEPLSALDAKVREELRQEIRAIQQRLGITTIMVTHDQNEALEMADQIVVLNGGKVEQAGSARALYDRPRTRFVAEFIGSINTFTVQDPQTDPHLGAVRLRTSQPLESSTLGVRPEAIKVLDDGQEADNVFAATIEKATFLGNMTVLHARLEAAPDQPVVFEAHGPADGLEPGRKLRLGIAAGDLKDLA
ncbi:ABC transporter ATP-binding protein [Stappia sp.]|uniref:ABC transporter ATP-binding protein n=1 Tax=Stappia sp. TaxID=1870903 RepID=UPI003C7B6E3E